MRALEHFRGLLGSIAGGLAVAFHHVEQQQSKSREQMLVGERNEPSHARNDDEPRPPPFQGPQPAVWPRSR
jgi:hypothetical protein